MQITINDVRYAVRTALDAMFPDIPVLDEELEQTPAPPYFFVRLLQSVHTQELSNRYRREYPFVVRYYAAERTNEAMYNMAEQLTTVLKSITVGGQQSSGQGMYFEIVDRVLHFYATYSLLVWEQQPEAAKMQTLKQEGFVHE